MKQKPLAGVRVPNGFMRVRHAAKQMRCSPRTVCRYIEAGKIQAVRVGLRYWAVFRLDVEFEASRRLR